MRIGIQYVAMDENRNEAMDEKYDMGENDDMNGKEPRE